VSIPWAVAVGAGGTIVFIIVCLCVFGWWLGVRNTEPRPSVQAPTESPMADEFDVLLPEGVTTREIPGGHVHHGPSGAAPGVTVRMIKRKPKKKAKTSVKPKRTPKTRRTRFERIDDD
jgi:hypothetical protein